MSSSSDNTRVRPVLTEDQKRAAVANANRAKKLFIDGLDKSTLELIGQESFNKLVYRKRQAPDILQFTGNANEEYRRLAEEALEKRARKDLEEFRDLEQRAAQDLEAMIKKLSDEEVPPPPKKLVVKPLSLSKKVVAKPLSLSKKLVVTESSSPPKKVVTEPSSLSKKVAVKVSSPSSPPKKVVAKALSLPKKAVVKVSSPSSPEKVVVKVSSPSSPSSPSSRYISPSDEDVIRSYKRSQIPRSRKT